MSAAIAPTGEAALSNQVDVPFRVAIPNHDVADFFELPRIYSQLCHLAPNLLATAPATTTPLSSSTAAASSDGLAHLPTLRVALQIPDEFLFTSDSIVSSLTSLHSAASSSSPPTFHLDPFVLADTQYSPCCVDEVAAMHFSAHCVVHFGRSCLSGVSHMPVVYAFGKLPVDVDHAVACLQQCLPQGNANDDKVLVVYDVTYAWAIPQMKEKLADATRFVFADVVAHEATEASVGYTMFKRQMPDKESIPQSWPLVMIAPPGPLVAHYSLVFNQHPLHHYNPLDLTLISPRSTLMKRYALMQKARDASVVGIVVGTLGVSNYLSTIATIKRLIRAHHKKYYTFVLGKLNVPKLANFMDIDVFVLVACPESSLIDSRDFYKPVVTPFELGMALDLASEWTGEYKLEFGQVNGWMDKQATELLAEEEQESAGQRDDQEDKDSPYFSLVTGTYVQRPKMANNADIHEHIKDLTLRDEASMQLALQSPAAQRLAQREWKGLDTSVPREEKSLKVVEGRFGNAAGYSDEPGKES